MPKLNHAYNPIQFYTATILEWKKLVSLLVLSPTLSLYP